MKTLRLLLADDHEVVRQGLRAILAERRDWTICAEAATGRRAVALARRQRPDVAILDLTMPDLHGLEATRQIRAALPDTAVLILTMHASEELAREAEAAGARGFVLKTDAGASLVAAVEALARGESFFSAAVSEALSGGGRRPRGVAQALGLGRLTPREREIVQLIAEGQSTKQLAAQLGISIKTAETHRTNILRKLRLHSVSEVVRYAIRNHLAEP